ncbi:hypothetical protein A2U01_0105976, partial [Trifolium medium]|nr:hypothetical protein [Trifolium medium]
VFVQFCIRSEEDKLDCDSDSESDSTLTSYADVSLQVCLQILGPQKSKLQSLTTSGSNVFRI